MKFTTQILCHGGHKLKTQRQSYGIGGEAAETCTLFNLGESVTSCLKYELVCYVTTNTYDEMGCLLK